MLIALARPLLPPESHALLPHGQDVAVFTKA